MGVTMLVILQLGVAFLLCSALGAGGSTESFPPISPVDGAASSPISQGTPLISSAPSPVPAWKGSTIPPSLTSPPLASSPSSSRGIAPSFAPETPMETPPPSSSASPPTTIRRSSSSPPPNASPIKAPIIGTPIAALAPTPASTPSVIPPRHSTRPASSPSKPAPTSTPSIIPPRHSSGPLSSPSKTAPTSTPSLIPPSHSPRPLNSPSKPAPISTPSIIPPPNSPSPVSSPSKPAPTSTPLIIPPPHSLNPVSSPSMPGSSPPSLGHSAPVEEPIAPVGSPRSIVARNSSAVPPLPPEVPSPRKKDYHVSPAKAPLHKRNMKPVAAPPTRPPNSLPPANHSPAPSTQNPNERSINPPPPSLSPLPSHEVYSPATSPSASRHHHPMNELVSPVPAPAYVVPSPTSQWQGPTNPPFTTPTSMQRNNAPPPFNPGSLILPPRSATPGPINNVSPAPSSSPNTAPAHPKTPSPKVTPSGTSPISPKIPFIPKMPAFPPPPPNEDCLGTVCTEPYTNTPPGSPCGCVWPMQVGLRLTVDLYTFFPMVLEFAAEIASGVFMKQSQVRIMGANAATEQPDKTVVLIDLVPLEQKFDNNTAFLTDQRFWNKQVAINASYFGDYEVLYVRYPGLPPSPPLPSDATIIDDGPYSADNNARTNKPLGVELPRRQHRHGLSGGVVAIIILSAIVAVVSCSAVVWILLLKRREHSSQQEPAPQALIPAGAKSSGIGGSTHGSGPSSASLSFGSSIATYTGSAKTFTASDIEKATDNFNDSRVLGEGGFGRVYSGTLDDGTRVAVKILKRDDQQGGREFLAEVEMLSRLHHRNLVKLIGICTEEHARCLVYELIPNGSLESHLHGVDKEAAPLDWTTRMKIALGAARGLAYLHEDSSPRVIHRDFKSSNILLEHDFTPKVADFGLARTALDEESRHISTRVMGTFGYVAPEYAMTGHLLVKSDVYSYGVVLLELLTGKKPVDMSQPLGQENLVTWARPLLTSKEGLEILIDPSLGPDVPFDSLSKVAAIASMCVQPEVSHRPFMGEVVQALKLVCSECDEAREGAGSRNLSQEDLSIDLEEAEGSSPGQSTLHGRHSDPNYSSRHDVERGLSISELFGTSRWYGRQVSGSYRRHSTSGPLRMGRGRNFWQRIRRLYGGSVSEHGIIS
ncbi:receptor-like serine/threonine-protein kinase ALE2 [Punica granatum]|uniref:Receptor-like serine/threonine-protein kinase ALE2 n=1 Tax=Punica granatum TaxID=22663 RepID=A0A6P8CVY9_PUNGR|nr:receptor-like serine/threonine-protein kinase ALE2 [Punica granatum]